MPVLINFKICDNSKDCSGIEVCPTGAFYWDEKKKTIAVDNKKCASCGKCEAACPVHAIHVARTEEESKKIKKEIDADPRKVSDLFVDRYGAEPTEPAFLISEKKFDAQILKSTQPAVVELLEGKRQNGIAGYWTKDSLQEIKEDGAPFIDMERLPVLPYHLIDLKKYMKYRGGDYSIALETSRGCDFRCAFCACPQYSSVWRGQSATKTVRDIKYLSQDLKIKTILIIDDNFFGDIGRANEIFRRLISEKVKVNLDIQGMRIDTAEKLSDEELRFMVAAGVRKVNIGIESGSQRILKFINKAITVKQVLAQNRRLSKFGPWVQYNFITGYPTETPDEIKETVHLALQLISENKKAMLNYLCIYTPLPGTKLYCYETQQGVHFPQSIEGWIDYDRIFVSARGGFELNIKLNILALFVDRKVSYYTKSLFLRFLVALYRPIARFRLRHFCFKGFLEGKLFLAINKLKFNF